MLVSVNVCEAGDEDGDDDDGPDDVGEAEQDGGHNTVITTHCPPSVVQHQTWHHETVRILSGQCTMSSLTDTVIASRDTCLLDQVKFDFFMFLKITCMDYLFHPLFVASLLQNFSGSY